MNSGKKKKKSVVDPTRNNVFLSHMQYAPKKQKLSVGKSVGMWEGVGGC